MTSNIFTVSLITVLVSSMNIGAMPVSNDSISSDSTGVHRRLASSGNFTNGFNADVPQYIPKAPTVSELVKQIDYPVSLYTGVPDITIPVYEIDAYGMKLPITLSYHASGIRLSQEASWVGLGWSLNAGGMVSRTIKCADDFLEYSISGNVTEGYLTAPEIENPRDSGYFLNVYEDVAFYRRVLVKDSEPDIFYYSLPGASGKFVIDKSRGAVLLNKQTGVKVELCDDPPFRKYFVITSPDGTRHTFRKYETTVSRSRPGYLNMNLPNATKFDEYEDKFDVYSTPNTYTSSWMLTDIESVNGRHIAFNYEQETYQAPLQESVVRHNILNTSYGYIVSPAGQTVYSCSKTLIETWRLSSITWEAGRVDFYCSGRSDEIGMTGYNPPLKLDSIKVTNNEGLMVKGMSFSYSYFNNNYSGNYPQVFKRLKLTSVTDLGDPTLTHSFLYHEGNMPAKNSKNTDYWGYYNGVGQGSDYFCPINYMGTVYIGADKSSHLEPMLIGTIHSVTSPTKGVTTFTFDTNKYHVEPSTSIVTEHVSDTYNVSYPFDYEDDLFLIYPRELRDTFSLPTSTTVSVSGFAEKLSSVPDPSVVYNNDQYATFSISKILSNGSKQLIFYYPSPNELNTSNSHTFESSEVPLGAGTYIFEAIAQTKDTWYSFSFEMDRSVVVQSDTIIRGGGLRVIQINGAVQKDYLYEGGKLLVEPVFGNKELLKTYVGDPEGSMSGHVYQTHCITQQSESTIPTSTLRDGNIFGYTKVTEMVGNTKKVYTYFNEKEQNYGYDFPYTPTILNCLNGFLSETESGDGMESEVYNYTLPEAESDVLGFVYDSGYDEICEYSYHIVWPMLSSVNTTSVETNGTIYTDKYYSYDDNLMMLTESISRGSDTYQKRYVYPTADSPDSVTRRMAACHMIGIPLETLLLKNGMVVDGKRTEYTDTLSMILPKREFKFESNQAKSLNNYQGSMTPKIRYSHYNEYGMPMEVWDRGIITSYLWGWKSLYPLAEIKNATYSDLEGSLGSGTISQIANANVPGSSLMNAVNILRDTMPSSLVTTFGFRPLVGVTSITDPRGFTTYYNYDAAGRLSEQYIIDPQGHKRVIEDYDYHYKE